MKTTTQAEGSLSIRPHGLWSCSVALLAWVAQAALPLPAAVIDDMCPPEKFFLYPGEMNQLNLELVDCQLVFSGQFPGPYEPSNPMINFDHTHWLLPALPDSLEGRTLETRIDVIRSSSADIAVLFCTLGPAGGYLVVKHETELWLIKFSETDYSMALLFSELAEVRTQDVTLVLSTTQQGTTNWIDFRVQDRVTGESLYQMPSFADGPGRDALPPAVPPRELTRFFSADQGAPYTEFTSLVVGIWQFPDEAPPPLEVAFDNLEYDVYRVPAIENSVLISWPDNTSQERIVAGAAAIEGPYAPCPEPMFKRFGSVCVSVPTAGTCQFWKLVPGTQFSDHFHDIQRPFSLRSPYTNIFARPQHQVTVTNGVLRVSAQGPMDMAGILLRAPSGPATVRDFYLSVDILDWTTSANHWSDVSLVARARGFPNNGNGYGAGLILNRTTGVPGDIESRILFGDESLQERMIWHGSTFNIRDDPPPYRLEFIGVGSNLTFRVLSLTTREVIQQISITDTTLADGWCGLYVDMPENLSESHEVVLDNFFLTGTTP